MTVNAVVTIINAAILVLLMYGMIGEASVMHIQSESGVASLRALDVATFLLQRREGLCKSA